MRSFYSDLGISRSANSRQIKAAYRALVKRLHPDLNPQTPSTVAELAKVNAAYAVLGHRDRRATYDKELGLARQAARRRLAGQGAIGVFTFAVAFSAILVVLPLIFTGLPYSGREGGEPRGPGLLRESANSMQVHEAPAPPRLALVDEEPLARAEVHGRSPPLPPPHLHEGEFETAPPSAKPPSAPSHEKPRVRPMARARQPDAAMSARRRTPPAVREAATKPLLAPPRDQVREQEGERGTEPLQRGKAVVLHGAGESSATSRRAPVAWKSLGAASTGFVIRYPASLFPMVRWSERARDLLALSRDGRAVIRMRSQDRDEFESLSTFRRHLLAGRYANADFVENAVSDSELTIAGQLGQELFFKRVVLACDRSLMRSVLVVYPQTEAAHFAPLVAEMRARLDMSGTSRAGCAR